MEKLTDEWETDPEAEENQLGGGGGDDDDDLGADGYEEMEEWVLQQVRPAVTVGSWCVRPGVRLRTWLSHPEVCSVRGVVLLVLRGMMWHGGTGRSPIFLLLVWPVRGAQLDVDDASGGDLDDNVTTDADGFTTEFLNEVRVRCSSLLPRDAHPLQPRSPAGSRLLGNTTRRPDARKALEGSMWSRLYV
jgi:hypothetical protein